MAREKSVVIDDPCDNQTDNPSLSHLLYRMYDFLLSNMILGGEMKLKEIPSSL
jgi:hypothetical protein